MSSICYVKSNLGSSLEAAVQADGHNLWCGTAFLSTAKQVVKLRNQKAELLEGKFASQLSSHFCDNQNDQANNAPAILTAEYKQ